MNTSFARPAGLATAQKLTTAQNETAAGESAPDADAAVTSFDYAQVAMALSPAAIGGAGSTPHMLTITAQLAAMLRARIRSGELVPNQPLPGEAELMRQYGVTRDTVRKAAGVLAGEGLVYVAEHRAYVADHPG